MFGLSKVHHKPRHCFKGEVFISFNTKAAKQLKPQKFNRSLLTYLFFLIFSKISAE